MTKKEFKAKVSIALSSIERETWEDFLEAVWQLHLEASNHWIPVEEGLPEKDNENSKFSVTVLAYNEDGYKDTAYYDYERKIWRWMSRVTHWMPLPEAPRKED